MPLANRKRHESKHDACTARRRGRGSGKHKPKINAPRAPSSMVTAPPVTNGVSVSDPHAKGDVPTEAVRMRARLALGLCIFSALMLTAGTVCGLVDGNWSPLSVLWNIFGPIVGAVFAFYFNRRPGRKSRNKARSI
jgi:hypothetical protein